MSVTELSPAQRHRAQVQAQRAAPAGQPIDPILRLPQVSECVGLSRSAIYRRLADHDFPRPLDLGGNAIGWRASAITQWLDARPAR